MVRSIVYSALKWAALGSAWLMGSASVFAQHTAARVQVPAQEPFDEANLPRPAVPQPTTPPNAPPRASREAALEARVAQLEAIVNQLQYQVSQKANLAPGSAGAAGGPGAAGGGMGISSGGVVRPEAGGAGGGQTGGMFYGPGVPGQSMPPNPNVQPRFDAPANLADASAKVRFGPGFEIMSEDEEYILQFHNLPQFDFRGEVRGGETLYHDTFIIPRQWWMWNGHVTKEIGYFVSLAQGIDSVNALDAFVDFNYDKRLQFRAGRFKSPFTYEFFVEPIQGLITPERSLFFNNFGENRDEGIMAYGQLFDAPNQSARFQYAVGIFNGNRNGYYANQNEKFISAFVNFHPFGAYEGSVLENFNFGGSVFAGNQAQPAVPAVFRTIVPTTGVADIGIPFLTLGDHTGQYGPMAFWDMHAAYFYQQLALIAEWQSGYQDYALNTTPASRSMHTRVPVGSYYVTAGYLLTGETRSQVGIVKPRRPFSLRPGEFGPGAWEVFARYNYLDIGNQIFTGGLASPVGNANRVWTTDLGLTWHMTQYIKMFFDWKHDEFNNPITYATGPTRTAGTADTLWWRLQLFF